MKRHQPTAEERAAIAKEGRLAKAREWLRYHENEARILGMYLRNEDPAGYFASEVIRLERAIGQLQAELKNTRERAQNSTPAKLAEHEREAKRYAREVAMIENEEKIAKLLELARTINAKLPDGMNVEQAIAMLQGKEVGA